MQEKDKRRSFNSPYFQVVVNVGMADPEVVHWLRDTFGGNVHSYEPRPGAKRGAHHWRLTAGQAIEFLRQIRPFLRLKHRQAELAIAYREDCRLNHIRHGGRGVHIPVDEIALRRQYAADIRSLNQREAPVR